MTSTYMMSSSVSCGVNYNNNLHNFSTYGLNYYNESTGSEFSDGYQSSISPDLSSCRMKNNNSSQFYPHESPYYPQYSQQQNSFKAVPHKNLNTNFCENSHAYGNETKNATGKYQKTQNFESFLIKKNSEDVKKAILDNKPVIIAPEVLKRRRSAANARERRRMNSLNFAFDK